MVLCVNSIQRSNLCWFLFEMILLYLQCDDTERNVEIISIPEIYNCNKYYSPQKLTLFSACSLFCFCGLEVIWGMLLRSWLLFSLLPGNSGECFSLLPTITDWQLYTELLNPLTLSPEDSELSTEMIKDKKKWLNYLNNWNNDTLVQTMGPTLKLWQMIEKLDM